MNRITSFFVIAAAGTAVMSLATESYAQIVCNPAPQTEGCKLAGKTKTSIHDDPDAASAAKDNMRFSWLKGDVIPGGGLGNPTIDGGTDYAVCIYDSVGGVYTMVKDLQIPANSALWSVKSANGFAFSDATMAFDGVLSLRLKADPAIVGKSQIKMKVRGINFNPPGPPETNPLQYFNQDPTVIVNVVNSVGTCWLAEYGPEHNRKVSVRDFRALTD